MARTSRKERMERRQFALQKVSSGMGISEVVDFVSAEWGCSRRTSLRDIELAQSELAHALNSVELQQMVCWMATPYQRLAARAEADRQLGRKTNLGRQPHPRMHDIINYIDFSKR